MKFLLILAAAAAMVIATLVYTLRPEPEYPMHWDEPDDGWECCA